MMGFVALLVHDPVLFAVLAVLLLYSIIAHEVAHGWVASLFGDDTARRAGRLTLNPVPHFDPVGMLMLFLVGFGWAKPVPVNYERLKSTRAGLFSVSLAGCAANILIATAGVFLLQLEAIRGQPLAVAVLSVLVRINVTLGALNLIPIPPLDGSKILMSFLPQRVWPQFAKWEPWGLFLLIMLLFTGLLNPLIRVMQNLIAAFIVSLLSGGRA